MNIILILVLVGLMGATLFTLARGIFTFLQASRDEIDRGGEGLLELQIKQNQLMRKRVMYQLLAIVVVALILATGS